MSDIIPTAEAAASAAVALAEIVRAMNEREAYVVPRTRTAIGIVLPLLEAIAAGRVFEGRSERGTRCGGEGHVSFCDAEITITEACPRCDGSGFEPVPPGRKQRTAYDAMIEDAAEGGALDEF